MSNTIDRSWTITSEADLQPIIDHLVPLLEQYKLVLLTGDLGAGKTTTVRHLIKALGSDSEVSSPTYSLINEYEIKDGRAIYHMDMYRLESLDEALDIGIEEYLYSDAVCIIEWPDLLMPLIDEEYLSMTIAKEDDGRRTFTITSDSVI